MVERIGAPVRSAPEVASPTGMSGISIPPVYTVVDLFCGCGGLSHGFSLTRRFRTLLGLDNKPEATESFALNCPDDPVMMTTDIRDSVTKEQLLQNLGTYGITGPRQLSCLIGGPPCEGFSQNRVERSAEGSGGRITKFTDDPRNKLFKWFIEIASELQPRVILIENVPDILRHRDGETAREIIEDLRELGYLTTARVLNAADYGVPQLRRRAFFLAYRQEDYETSRVRLEFPNVTHSPYPLGHELLDKDPEWFPGDMGFWPSVREAIGDLPRPADGKASRLDGWTPYEGHHPSSDLRRFLAASEGGTWNHIARPLGKNGLQRVKELDNLDADVLHQRRRDRVHYHYAYSRLRWAEPARTITKFVYHVGSGMFCHPDEDRAVTIREAARLQTFPDHFKFPAYTIRDVSSLVGSAVPPLLARAIARQVVRYLDTVTLHGLSSVARSELRELKGDAVVRRLENNDWLPA
ncbi:DNA cytosine methyltransferase [Sphaerisporangium sp. B11E5]|uniref:DNA cytosine methyltransferase n=1 Tax=Sphaerisporangium sp. B11E5 TaxID=3153563 RepID=UPI00325CC175